MSICDGPPDWCRKTTRLALGGKCGSPGSPAAKPSRASREPSAATPIPVALREKKWRLVMSILFLGDGLVQIQDGGGHSGPRREFHSFDVAGLVCAPRDQLRGGRGILAIALELARCKICEDLEFGGTGPAPGGFTEKETSAGRAVAAGFQHGSLRECSRGFDVRRVVEQHERLQGRVGNQAARGALFAIGRV